MKKKKRYISKSRSEKYEFSKDLFISNDNNIEENVLKIIKKNNNPSKKP